jgi:hypothetical protein
MNISPLIDRLIAAGISPGEAGAIAAEIYAAGVASASTRTAGAERTRRWRESRASQSDGKRHQTSHGDAASQTAQTSQNVTERHKPSQCDVSPVLHREKNIRKSSMQNSERSSRGSRIASDWSPTMADRQAATDEGFSNQEIDREALRFRDYWTAKAGAGGVKLDWQATWRNWVRNSAEKLGKSPTRSATDVAGADDGKIEVTDPEQLEAWDAYARGRGAKSFPRNSRGGWRFPSPWPPGWKQPERSREIAVPRMQTIQ